MTFLFRDLGQEDREMGMLNLSSESYCFVCSVFVSQENLRSAFMVAQRPTEQGKVKMQGRRDK